MERHCLSRSGCAEPLAGQVFPNSYRRSPQPTSQNSSIPTINHPNPSPKIINPQKFKGKYRIPSARAKGWDYRSPGAYFITACTKDRADNFGYIEDNQMHLSPQGVLAGVFWHEIKHHAKQVRLDACVVMPNHEHGILIWEGAESASESVVVDTGHAPYLQLKTSKNQSKNVKIICLAVTNIE